MNVFAVAKTVVVVPLHDGQSDNISDDLSEAFSKAMVKQGVAVVSKEKVAAVMGYYEQFKKENRPNTDYDSAITMAKEHYYNFDYEEASAQITSAIKQLEREKDNISEIGGALRDAYVVAAIIEKSAKNGDKSTSAYFKKALNIDPSYSIDVSAFSPSIVELFNLAKIDSSKIPSGSVFVETDPKAAEVYINGILRGVTPVAISNLPEGHYIVSINTNKYQKVIKGVNISGGKTEKVKEKLAWLGGSDNNKGKNFLQKDEAREEIDEGGRIADLLKVSKVILVDADEVENGSGSISLRMVDRQYRAGHNPVVVKYSADRKNLLADLTSATGILTEQMKLNLLKNPQKHLDPDGIGDPVLLGRRNKAIYAIPAFWVRVGGALAATAGGAAAAVAVSGDDDKPANGSVKVQFKVTHSGFFDLEPLAFIVR